MSEQQLTVGRIVHYTLGDGDVAEINRQRTDAHRHLDEHRERADGSQIHVGNTARAGDVYPAVIVRVFSQDSGCSNLKVLLDGNDDYWATSRLLDKPDVDAKRYSPHPGHPGYQGGTWHWPERV